MTSNPFGRAIRPRDTVPDNTFALLYCQIVDYYRDRIHTTHELEEKLSEFGFDVGRRLCDKFFFKERGLKREIRLLSILLLLKAQFWKYLFGREADQLDQATDADGVYYLTDSNSVVVRYMSLPRETALNCGAFLAGIAKAFLGGAGFTCVVNAAVHPSGLGTTLIIEFDESVLRREKAFDEKK